jgi:signal transduction histidine kinase/ActR/RegA family two-component response regulator
MKSSTIRFLGALMQSQGNSLHSVWLALLFVLIHTVAQADTLQQGNSPYPLDQSSHSLTTALYWLEDPTDSLTAQEIFSNELIQTFNSNTNPDINLGYRKGTLWFYLPVQPITLKSTQQNWHLVINSLMQAPVEVFVYNQNGQAKSVQSKLSTSNRIYSPNNTRQLNLSANETNMILFKIKSNKPIRFSLNLLSSNELNNVATQEIVSYSILLGIFGVMFFYGIFAFYISKNFNHLFYLLFIASLGILASSASGHANQYLWQNSSYWSSLSIPLSSSLCCILAVRFTRHFFKTKENVSINDKFLLSCTIAAITLFFTTFFIDPSLAHKCAIALFTLTAAMIIIATSVSLKYRYNSARFYWLAWGFLLLGWVIMALAGTSFVPFNFYTQNAFVISSALAVVFLPLALEDYINHRLRRKISLKEKIHEQLETANQDLNLTLSELAKSNRVKDQFLATISHELRTPMNGVEGSLDLLDTSTLNPQQLEYVTSAKLAAREMTSLVDSILKISEIQAGHINLRQSCFEIRPSLNTAAVDFQHQCQRKNIAFNWYIDKDVPLYLEGDLENITLIIHQLIDNAIKFTHCGQVTVDITVKKNDPRKPELQIIVIDTGTGIPPQQLQQVFNPFHQLDNDNNRRYKGLGIGLAICSQLATIMGGKLTAHSQVGIGTTMTVCLPVNHVKIDQSTVPGVPLIFDSKAPLENPIVKRNSHHQKTILIAEDNPVNQMVLNGMIHSLDCHVLTAENGQEVLKLLDEQPIDLILMDCQMPNVDGFEATEKIRQSNKPYSNIPIIAVTANAMTRDNVRCITAGMNDYIKKPISREVVLKKVSHWLKIPFETENKNGTESAA